VLILLALNFSVQLSVADLKEEYNGDDEKLKGWEREYIFTLNENGEWRFNGFSGEVNFLGEDYNMNYLELKR